MNTFCQYSALAALLGVALGAFGAHALKAALSTDALAVWKTAVEVHFYHALALLVIGLLLVRLPASALLRWSGWLMTAGLLLFSGSLYLLALTGQPSLGMITPLGGLALLAAWSLLVAAVAHAA